MIDGYDSRFGICENCGHELRETRDGSGIYEHFTREYKAFGYPCTTNKCHAPGCGCNSPRP